MVSGRWLVVIANSSFNFNFNIVRQSDFLSRVFLFRDRLDRKPVVFVKKYKDFAHKSAVYIPLNLKQEVDFS